MYTLTRHGEVVGERKTYNECLMLLHRVQGQSWHYAMKWDGYAIDGPDTGSDYSTVEDVCAGYRYADADPETETEYCVCGHERSSHDPETGECYACE